MDGDYCGRCAGSHRKGVPERRSFPRRFLEGLVAPFLALQYLSPSRRMLRYFFLPICINIAAFLVLLAAVVLIGPTLLGTYVTESEILKWILMVSLVLAFFIVAFFTFNVLGPVFAGPFLEPLSRRVESDLLGDPPDEKGSGFVRETAWSIAQALGMVWVALATLVITLPLPLCIPILGAPLAVAISAWVVGLEYLDCALARKRYTLVEKISFIWANKARSMGLGLAAYGLLLLPLVNLLVIPLVAAGATRVFLDCETKSPNDDRR